MDSLGMNDIVVLNVRMYRVSNVMETRYFLVRQTKYLKDDKRFRTETADKISIRQLGAVKEIYND